MASLYGDDEHPIIEMLLDGTWTDVSARVRNAQKVDITRGRANEQSRVASQKARFTTDNADGFFSTRLPSSVNYRKIGKNTQVRVLAGRGDCHLDIPYTDTDPSLLGGAITADKASLDVTGDIDIRFEIHPHRWRPTAPMMIAGKYASTGNQRSWLVRFSAGGILNFRWSNDGTTILTSVSTIAIPATSGRLAVRVTLDVNDGAGNRVVTWYTSDSIDGAWTVFDTVTTAGTTSVFASTASLAIGRSSENDSPIVGTTRFFGRLYALQVRNGIGGTLVANFDARGQTLGATTWSDGLAAPNTWTLDVGPPSPRITSDRVRFWGEIAALPKQWDTTGTDATVSIQAAGLLRRLSQGAKPLDSAMTRNFRGVRSFGWWPLEDGSEAESAANLAPGVDPEAAIYPGQITTATFGTSEAPPGAKGSLGFSAATSRFNGRLSVREQFAPATYNFVFYVKFDSLPTTDKVFFEIGTFGPMSKITVSVSTTQWRIEFFDLLGVSITSQSVAVGLINPTDAWVGYNLVLKDSGANMTYSQRWDTIGTFGGGTGPTTIVGQYAQPPDYVRFTAANDAAYQSMRLSHVFVSDQDIDLSNDTFRDASNAYRGETAIERQTRLAAEEGVAIRFTGLSADTETMGYQGVKTLPDLLAECWEVDGGQGGEARDALCLEYRTRADTEQRDDVTFSHSGHDLAAPPQPTDDDAGFTNDVTVTRTGGSAARVVVNEGYTSVADPPAGVGRFATDTTLNLADDDRLPSAAGWLALVGSWDQDRYPSLAAGLHREHMLDDTALFNATVALRLGDTATLADLPAWMPPDDVPQLVQGYTEQLSRFLWEIEYNATPAGPHQSVPLLGLTTRVPRLDATTHTSGGSLTTTATTVSLVTSSGSALWVTSAAYPDDFPFTIEIDGEWMSVTAITGSSSPQSATVTRSINGVVKTHAVGALVRLAEPFYVGR